MSLFAVPAKRRHRPNGCADRGNKLRGRFGRHRARPSWPCGSIGEPGHATSAMRRAGGFSCHVQDRHCDRSRQGRFGRPSEPCRVSLRESQSRQTGAVKYPFSFRHSLSHLLFETGAPVRLPPIRATLTGRIPGESSTVKMLALEATPRTHAMVRSIYLCGRRLLEARAPGAVTSASARTRVRLRGADQAFEAGQ